MAGRPIDADRARQAERRIGQHALKEVMNPTHTVPGNVKPEEKSCFQFLIYIDTNSADTINVYHNLSIRIGLLPSRIPEDVIALSPGKNYGNLRDENVRIKRSFWANLLHRGWILAAI